MKAIFKLALAVSAVATASAQPHAHGHHHGRRQVPSRVEKRIPDKATTWVDTVETEYRLIGGEEVSPEDAAKGIADGLYIVVGSSTPSPATNDDDDDDDDDNDDAEATKSVSAGNFIEHQTSSASSSTKTAAPTAQADSSSSAASVSSTGSGVDSEFPSGEIACSSFPDSYGAVAADWLGLSKWTGIQKVPNYKPGDSSIDYIETAVGGGCVANSFCSYRCPEGYQKSQWPESQGATGQSIGGLYCNSNGKLELSRPSVKTLCTAGEGGVTISNKLSQSVAVCRTDYPGSESMTIPVDCSAGGTNTVTNPNQETYKWGGKLTSAQYYINPKGVSVANACLWTSPTNPSDAGNWAPIVLGVGKNNGITYIGLFPNTPTSTAPLDFNVKITGGSTECKYENGAFSGGSNGCTVAFTNSQEASIVFY